MIPGDEMLQRTTLLHNSTGATILSSIGNTIKILFIEVAITNCFILSESHTEHGGSGTLVSMLCLIVFLWSYLIAGIGSGGQTFIHLCMCGRQ